MLNREHRQSTEYYNNQHNAEGKAEHYSHHDSERYIVHRRQRSHSDAGISRRDRRRDPEKRCSSVGRSNIEMRKAVEEVYMKPQGPSSSKAPPVPPPLSPSERSSMWSFRSEDMDTIYQEIDETTLPDSENNDAKAGTSAYGNTLDVPCRPDYPKHSTKAQSSKEQLIRLERFESLEEIPQTTVPKECIRRHNNEEITPKGKPLYDVMQNQFKQSKNKWVSTSSVFDRRYGDDFERNDNSKKQKVTVFIM